MRDIIARTGKAWLLFANDVITYLENQEKQYKHSENLNPDTDPNALCQFAVRMLKRSFQWNVQI